MRQLTATALQSLLRKPPEQRVDLMDGAVPGLMLRIGRGGTTWSLRFRVVGEGGITNRGHQKKGSKGRVTLGEYPALSIEGARALANTYLDQARKGISPVAGLEASAAAGGLTVGALASKFLDDYVRMKELRASLKYVGVIRVHIEPHIGNVLAHVLSREQVRALLKKVMVRQARGDGPRGRPRGGKEAARSTITVLRKMINWGIRERLLRRNDNPVCGMEDNLPKKRQKDRVLSLEEARILWEAAQTLNYPFGPAYQLVLLTGCRPQAIEILEAVRAKNSGQKGDYIFSGTDGEHPLTSWSKSQTRMMKALCAVSGDREMPRWTPHDLRRTVATRLAEKLGVGGEQLIKRVLGHADSSATAIYNRYGCVKEMRVVLEKWAADLTVACEPVTELQRFPSQRRPLAVTENAA